MHVIQLLPELNEGGVERSVVELNRELVLQGIASTVISRGGRLVRDIEGAGGRHVALDLCSKNLLTVPWRVYRLRQTLAKLKPDIVHVNSRVPAWLLRFANRTLRLPVVSTIHGFNSVNVYSRIMTHADRLFCVSPAVKAHVQTHYGVPDRILHVVPCGLNPAAFDPARLNAGFLTHFRREQELDGRFVVTTVGRITPLKDYETFIRGIAAVRQTLPNVLGLIAGGTRADKQEYHERLQSLVRELHVQDAVRFVGSQSNMAEIYRLSHAVVSCSRRPEGFGLTLIEALAMERPVIATRHGGAREIVREGRNGLLFAPGNAPELAAALIDLHGRSFTGLRDDVVTRFSLATTTRSTLAVYRGLLAERAPAAEPAGILVPGRTVALADSRV